VIDTQYLIADQ